MRRYLVGSLVGAVLVAATATVLFVAVAGAASPSQSATTTVGTASCGAVMRTDFVWSAYSTAKNIEVDVFDRTANDTEVGHIVVSATNSGNLQFNLSSGVVVGDSYYAQGTVLGKSGPLVQTTSNDFTAVAC